MQIICTSLQIDNHASTLSLNFYRTDALPDAQPTVSKTEGNRMLICWIIQASWMYRLLSLWEGANLRQQSMIITAHMCTYHCAQVSYTTQHRAVLIIFPLNLQPVIIFQTSSIAGQGNCGQRNKFLIVLPSHTCNNNFVSYMTQRMHNQSRMAWTDPVLAIQQQFKNTV